MGNTKDNQIVGFHIMAKPVGPCCNLNCTYCYYLEKKAMFSTSETNRMTDEILEAFISKYIDSQPVSEVPFVWQGGEPTLLGIDFYKRIVALQKKYSKGKAIRNSLQTNGTLLDDEWCKFLKKHNFLVGLSLDGPEDMHNRYRRDFSGKAVFDSVLRGLKLLQKYGIDYNVLCCINKESSKKPLDIYHFLKEQGVSFIQFMPIVERMPDARAEKVGLKLGVPPELDKEEEVEVTPWSVEPESYGDFLITVFDEWVRNDVDKIFVMNFEWAISSWRGYYPCACFFSNKCGRCLVIEHNGNIYSCDHYVYPHHYLGNILTDDLNKMVNSAEQISFGEIKETKLPQDCKDCDALFACRGECPKHRFTKAIYYVDEPGLNYLCAGYKKYFEHIHRYVKTIAQLIENNYPASLVMKAIDRPLVIKTM
jgi:uncharacterized protein